MVAMLHGKTHGVQSGITLGFLSWLGGGGGGGWGGGGGGEGEELDSFYFLEREVGCCFFYSLEGY